MRYVTDVEIDEAIVHILNTDSSTQAELSERTLPLQENAKLVEYFKDHIVNSLRDPTATAARFTALANDNVAGICAALLGDRPDIVSGSQSLALKLHAIAVNDARIKPGNLATLRYHANDDGMMMRYLALMKIDPSPAWRPIRLHDETGKLYIGFEQTSDALPTTREKLQKCAFVRLPEPGADYDMMLLDRLQGSQDEKLIAKFFSETFLGAELALDARQRTLRFYHAALVAKSQVQDQITPDQAEAMREAIDAAVKADVINVDTWVAALPLPEPQKEQVNQALNKDLPDREFQIDRSYVKSLPNRRGFVGDHGLRVQMRADGYDQVIKSAVYVAEPGQPPHWRVIIETEKWQEVPQ